MKGVYLVIPVAVVVGGAVVSVPRVARARAAIAVKSSGSKTPVLVELFTSEGCSSCPPADKLLSKLAETGSLENALVIPLSEHVDYWNSGGWKDRFSSSVFSNRQEDYARILHADVYTPQMVVDGEAQFVGSDPDMAATSIAAAGLKQKIKVNVSATLVGTRTVSVSIAIGALPGSEPSGSEAVYLAVTENHLNTQVQGGENEGHKLEHTAVVRTLQKLGTLGRQLEFTSSVRLDPSWKTQDLSAVAFIQNQKTGQVRGVGAAGVGGA
jgi:hypothetical protein